MSSVSIIIPNFNGLELLKKYFPAVIDAWNESKNQIGEVIVVDNGSTDGSVDYLEKTFSQVKIIKNKKNLGFSKAINAGAKIAKGEFLCLLNTDVKPEKDFLVRVLSQFEDSYVFAISFNERNFPPSGGFFEKGFVVHQPIKTAVTCHTFWVSGGSGVFRKKIWDFLGGFDEINFSPYYWEDIDLSYRAMKVGYRLLWSHKGVVYHEHESSTKKVPAWYRTYIQERNYLLFHWKNLTSATLLQKHLVALTKKIVNHPGFLKPFFGAVIKLPTLIRERRKTKKLEKVSDEAIFAQFK
jgi:GT2 family glycosyltransferase